MPLEGLGPAVGSVAADLTCVGDVEAMQLVQPVGDGLWGGGQGGREEEGGREGEREGGREEEGEGGREGGRKREGGRVREGEAQG